MKTCNKCNTSKPESDFAIVKGKLFSTCKKCKNASNKAWYEKNKAKRIQQVIARKKEQMIIAYKWKWDYLFERGCAWEGCEVRDPRMLELDHLDQTTKLMSISEMIRNGHSLENIMAEAEKCRVLCANHHRLWTAEQNNWWSFTNNTYIQAEPMRL